MDLHATYVRNIQSRSKFRFYIGAVARFKRFIYNLYSVNLARRRGAAIGCYVTLPLNLARRANKNLKIGDHCSIHTTKIDLRASVIIGNYVIIGSDVDIITCSHNIDSIDWEHKKYGIQIEDYVWVASKVLILPTCRRIEEGAVLAAGSVVVKNVSRMNVISGNPATFLRERVQVHKNLCVEGLLGNDLITYLNARNLR
jgi:acetyltransferase-like isoleucine patch superfamily enzyme